MYLHINARDLNTMENNLSAGLIALPTGQLLVRINGKSNKNDQLRAAYIRKLKKTKDENMRQATRKDLEKLKEGDIVFLNSTEAVFLSIASAQFKMSYPVRLVDTDHKYSVAVKIDEIYIKEDVGHVPIDREEF